MALTYCTLAQYKSVKRIGEQVAADDQKITDYLRRATRLIDGYCNRRFYPWVERRSFTVPSEFIDLRTRTYPGADLSLDQDLLEILTVETGNPLTTGLTNGAFDADSDWTKGAGWTIAGGKATKAAGTGSDLSQAGVLTDATRYRLAFTVRNRTAGILTAKLGSTGAALAVASNGPHSLAGLAGGADVIFSADATFDGDLDDAVLYTGLTELVEGTDLFTVPLNVWPKWALRLVWPNFWTGTYNANLGGSLRTPVIFVEGIWGFQEDYLWHSPWEDTGQAVTLADAVDTTFTLTGIDLRDPHGQVAIPDDCLLRVEDELMEVVSVVEVDADDTLNDETQVTVVRGARGSQAVAHANRPLTRWRVVEDVAEACLQAAKAWKAHDEAAGGRIGVTQMSVGVEIDIPDSAKRLLQDYRRGVSLDSYA